MTYPTYMDITTKMAGQKNLLFIFEFQANNEKMIGVLFTFGQVEAPLDKKSAPKQVKTQVGN